MAKKDLVSRLKRFTTLRHVRKLILSPWPPSKNVSRLRANINALLKAAEYCKSVKHLTLAFRPFFKRTSRKHADEVFNVLRKIKCNGKVKVYEAPFFSQSYKGIGLLVLKEALDAYAVRRPWKCEYCMLTRN